MNFYKISYTINARNERVYPPKIKGVVFTSTQDHPSENFMVGGTEAAVTADGKAIVALTAAEAEALTKQLRDAFQVPTPLMMGVPAPQMQLPPQAQPQMQPQPQVVQPPIGRPKPDTSPGPGPVLTESLQVPPTVKPADR
jgi:hypothetical protein